MSQISSTTILVLDYSGRPDDIEQTLKYSCAQFDLVLFISHANAKEIFCDVDDFVRRHEPKNFHVFDLSRSLGENESSRSVQVVGSHNLIRSLIRSGVVLYVPASSKINLDLRQTLRKNIEEWLRHDRTFGILDEIPGSFAAILESGINLKNDENGSISISFH